MKNLKLHNFVMAYPAKEEFALASLGYMWLYKTACETKEIVTDRIATDNINIDTRKIDSLAFSLSFDFDFMGVFEILDKLKLPFYASQRSENTPLIFAGGPVITTNPRPYEKIFDFMIIGDGETVITKILNIIKSEPDKKKALEKISKLDGIYIPNCKVQKITEPLTNVIYTPVISEKSYFKNTFIIEVSRGCMNRCAFCTASYINLPFRNYEYENIIEAIEIGLSKTNKIALLGAQISAHPKFKDIMKYLRNKMEAGTNIELGISSLRTDAIDSEIIQTLVLGGQKHSTIAIEAGSERLRKFINKNLKEQQILNAINIARENGLKGLKIYSMIGIPTETMQDIEEFINLAKKIKLENKGFNVEFSFSTFVPKPQTPFQWTHRENSKSLEKKQKYLEKEIAKIGLSSKFSSIKWDYWQTVLSRGDENLTPLLEYVYKNGGNLSSYKSGIKKLSIDITKTIDGYNPNEPLPWDIIDNTLTKDLLKKEYKRLLKK